jgi:predicted lipoprotein with Yx(FWY)xxD motif
MLANSFMGSYLVDGMGKTLYYFTRDSVNQSNATAAQIVVWPVFYAATNKVPSTLDATDFGSITRIDGKMQTTFKGFPLYYYAKDLLPGDMLGQGIGGVWFIITPQNFKPASASSGSPGY